MSLKKVQYKIGVGDKEKWVHFCYIPAELKEEFDEKVNEYNMPLGTWVTKWANEDFEIVDIENPDTLDLLRDKIKEKYKHTYPDIYRESATDAQGWLRVWVIQHMREEVDMSGR